MSTIRYRRVKPVPSDAHDVAEPNVVSRSVSGATAFMLLALITLILLLMILAGFNTEREKSQLTYA
jgi:hypothetical protein